jgi:hypothetical protein
LLVPQQALPGLRDKQAGKYNQNNDYRCPPIYFFGAWTKERGIKGHKRRFNIRVEQGLCF